LKVVNGINSILLFILYGVNPGGRFCFLPRASFDGGKLHGHVEFQVVESLKVEDSFQFHWKSSTEEIQKVEFPNGLITNFIVSLHFVGVEETVGLGNRFCWQQGVAALTLHDDLVGFV